MIKRAIILAGGKGTRLKPFTKILPKPLMPIGKFTILEIVIRQLKYYGFKNIEEIKNREKIKWVYLKQNPLGISQIAFKGYDDPDKILDFSLVVD